MGARKVISDDEEDHKDKLDRNAQGVKAANGDEENKEEGRQSECEKDDFIVNDAKQEGDVNESSDEEIKPKKRKRKKRVAEEKYKLDEDDYELIREANAAGFPHPKSGGKTFRRLKKAVRNVDMDEKTGFSDKDNLEDGGQRGRGGLLSEDGAEEGDQPEEVEEDDIGEEDEMADFIVDEEEVDENGNNVRQRKSEKRATRQASGIPSSVLGKAPDIFGGVEDFSNHCKQVMKGKGLYISEGADDDPGCSKPKRLEHEFEPSILVDNYLTVKDDQTWETDVPERLHFSEELSIRVPHNEAKWIYEQVFGSSVVPMRTELQHIAKLDRGEVVKEIDNVLTMLHDQKFEVPFIAMYRKEMCPNLLRDPEQDLDETEHREKKTRLNKYKALWAIKLWDKKWFLLQRRKTALKALYEKCAREAARRDHSKGELLETVFESLTNAESERTIDDIDAKFNLHFPPDEVEVEEGQFKRPKHKSLYSICRKARLGVVSNKFGLTSEQLGKNLLAMYKRHEVEDACTIPEDIAAECLAGEFGDPESVLQGARHMAAVEISCEPEVKEYVRGRYMERAVVTTRPTAEGNSAIDSFHQYAGVKWLCNKPLNMFNDAQWLIIQKAEEEKLLQVTICLPKEVIDETLMTEFEGQYFSDGVSRVAQLWNEQRKLILRDALCSHILPSMEKEARMILSARAKSWLVQDYGTQLWNKVAVAPFRRQNTENEDCSDEDAAPRVMACCWGPGKPLTTFVMLDAAGEVLDILYAGFLSTRSQSAWHQQRKQNDQQRLFKFMVDHQPHVVVLGTACFSCKRLKDDISEVIFRITEEHPCKLPEGVDIINVVYADEALPRLYENSSISQKQLPGQQGIVRRAVALGRYLQNPLAMFATLCGPGREVLSLKLNSLEHFLSPDERYEAVEQVMITITNQVGVDINLVASHEWMFTPLQFVSGLGPRKALLLQRAILRAGWIYSRRELADLGVMKHCVFKNAAGFLRIRVVGQAASGNHVIDPLEDTRIHPESYELAKKMAKDANAEEKGEDIDDVDGDIQEMAVKCVKNNNQWLKTLDIDEYARIVEQQMHTKRHETLYDIKMELQCGFQDWRTPYREPSQDEEFFLLTGENDQTLAEGRIVQATVWKVQHQRVMCTLESGLKGLIIKEELSDEIDIDPTQKITEGSRLTCRIKGIQKDKYIVDLSCKASELLGDNWQWGQKDCYYAKDECMLCSEQEKTCKEKEPAKKSFQPRMIMHPHFQNISIDEAIQALSDKDVGESIIRPSSRGPSYLSLTLKVYDGIYAHKDIVEAGKDHRDFPSFLRLGKTLSIGDDTFVDLDEVIDRYVDPLVSNLKAMLAYKKFKRGTKIEVDDVLRKEKLENPTRILYYLCVSHEYPGAFMLSYIRNTNPHHEYVGLHPKGFKFRKRMFEDLDKLVAHFQRHITDLDQVSFPPTRSVAETVPTKSPGHGGSAYGGGGSAMNGGAGNDGWQVGFSTDWERSSTPGLRTGANDHNHYSTRYGHPSGLPRPHPHDRGRGARGGGRCRWNEERGGGFGRGGRNEGKGGGLGRYGNDGRDVGMKGRWNENGGRKWGRDGRRGRGGRGGHGTDFGTRWGQKSSAEDSGGSCRPLGDVVWASKNEEWGNNSGNRNQDSSTGGGWTACSGEGGWNKQGDGGWGAAQASDAQNAFKDIDTWEASSKDGTSGWDAAPKSEDGGWDTYEKGGDGMWDAAAQCGSEDAGWDASSKDGDTTLVEGGSGDGGRDASKKDYDSMWDSSAKNGWEGDGGSKRGRAGGRGRGRGGRGGHGTNFSMRWGQKSNAEDSHGSSGHPLGGNTWLSKNEEWVYNSGNRDWDSPAGGGWTACSGESGLNKQGDDGWDSPAGGGWTACSGESGSNKQGDDGWDAAQASDHWNASKDMGTWEDTSQGGTSGWDAVPNGGNGGWDAFNKGGDRDGGWNASSKGGHTVWHAMAKGGSGHGGRDDSEKGDDSMWDDTAKEGRVDGGSKRGRYGGRGKGGRWGRGLNFSTRWGQKSSVGDIWASTNEEWGSNSGSRNQYSPATRGWTVNSGESGWNEQGNDGWDAAKGNDGWNVSKGIDTWDPTSKGGTTGWKAISKGSDGGRDAFNKGCDSMLDVSKGGNGDGGWDASSKGGNTTWAAIGRGDSGNGGMEALQKGDAAIDDSRVDGQCDASNKGGDDAWDAATKGVTVRCNNADRDGSGKWDPKSRGSIDSWGEASKIDDDTWDAAKNNDKRSFEAIKPNDGWGGVEGTMEQITNSGTDGWGVDTGLKDSGAMDNEGTANGWATETDGWGEG